MVPYRILYPKKDATLYEYSPEQNTGIDQILELSKLQGTIIPLADDNSSTWEEGSVSRIVMKFNLTPVQEYINKGYISGSVKAFLELKATEARNTNFQYIIEAYPLSQDWENGNGNYNDNPQIKNGVSWKSAGVGVEWNSGSTGYRNNTSAGGGAWINSYRATQSFELQMPDVYMDVSNIVNGWLNGDIDNHGFLLKYSDSQETGSAIIGDLKFFGRETHTIYVPKLIVTGENTGSYSGSFESTDLVDEEFVIKVNGLRPDFVNGEVAKLRVFVRDKYLTKNHSNNQNHKTTKRLPSNTYYKIVDSVTQEEVIGFNDGTKLQTDDKGHFIMLGIDNFMPKRFYELIFKVEWGDSIDIYRNKFFFKVER